MKKRKILLYMMMASLFGTALAGNMARAEILDDPRFAQLGFDAEYRPWIADDGKCRGVVHKRNGEMVFLPVLSGRIILGLVLDEGEHKAFAEKLGATLYSSLPQKDTPEPASNKSGLMSGEREVSEDLFRHLLKMPHFKLAEGEPEVVVFTWETCPSCHSLKNVLKGMENKKGIIEVPVGGNAASVKKALERFAEGGEKRSDLEKRMHEMAALLNTLTGKIAVPAYAFRMPDGTYRLGNIPMQKALERISGRD